MDKLDLVDFCKKLNDIKKEEHKNEFIKSYANYKEQIVNIDKYMENAEKMRCKYKELDIASLFTLLESYNKSCLLEDIVNAKIIIEELELKIKDSDTAITITKI
jgi:hypothetical protein